MSLPYTFNILTRLPQPELYNVWRPSAILLSDFIMPLPPPCKRDFLWKMKNVIPNYHRSRQLADIIDERSPNHARIACQSMLYSSTAVRPTIRLPTCIYGIMWLLVGPNYSKNITVLDHLYHGEWQSVQPLVATRPHTNVPQLPQYIRARHVKHITKKWSLEGSTIYIHVNSCILNHGPPKK